MRFSKKDLVQDSEILGAIICGAQEKPLVLYDQGVERKKSVCAIGAGNLGRKNNKKSDIVNTGYINGKLHEKDPAKRFAKICNVSIDYVGGVNDGFEGIVQASKSLFDAKIDTTSKDYLRGWAVGAAAGVYAESMSSPLGFCPNS